MLIKLHFGRKWHNLKFSDFHCSSNSGKREMFFLKVKLWTKCCHVGYPFLKVANMEWHFIDME